MIRTIQCTNGETCWAEECTNAGMCMHQDEAQGPIVYPASITAFVCPPRCEHVMDGQAESITEHSTIWTRVCSKCGLSAFDISMMEGE